MDTLDDSSDFIEPASDDVSFDTQDFAAVTSDYDPTVNESLYGSVTSSVCAHVYENGRRYHMYKQGRYPLPNDDSEYSRESICHSLFLDLLSGKYYLAPIATPQKVLDIGTGFGEWAIESRCPGATVIGIDLSPIQPVWVPPNVEFVVEDAEEDQWVHGDDFDLVHFRMTAIVLRDPIQVAAKAFEHIKPGGWVEFQEAYSRACCNDGNLPADYAFTRFFHMCNELMSRKYGWDLFVVERLPAELERLGFVNIQRKVCHVPIGFWSKDTRRMHHAFLYREIVTEFMPALRAKPLAGNDVGYSPEEIDELFSSVRAAATSRHIHAYVPFHFVCAQKPPIS